MSIDKTIPNLENATPGFLVDELGRIRAEAKRLEFLEGVYKQALEARITENQKAGADFIRGERFIAEYSYSTQERISAPLVREALQDRPDILARCINVTTMKKLITKPNPLAVDGRGGK